MYKAARRHGVNKKEAYLLKVSFFFPSGDCVGVPSVFFNMAVNRNDFYLPGNEFSTLLQGFFCS